MLSPPQNMQNREKTQVNTRRKCYRQEHRKHNRCTLRRKTGRCAGKPYKPFYSEIKDRQPLAHDA
jgi:hypothetical protein